MVEREVGSKRRNTRTLTLELPRFQSGGENQAGLLVLSAFEGVGAGEHQRCVLTLALGGDKAGTGKGWWHTSTTKLVPDLFPN